jgi:hypothetical protein
MGHVTLRQLSRQLADGRIGHEEYRRRRARLIEETLAALHADSESTGPNTDPPPSRADRGRRAR